MQKFSGARLAIGQAIYIRNPSMQKGWLRPYRLDSVAYYIVLKFVDKQRKNLITSYKLFKPRIQLKDGLYYLS